MNLHVTCHQPTLTEALDEAMRHACSYFGLDVEVYLLVNNIRPYYVGTARLYETEIAVQPVDNLIVPRKTRALDSTP